MTVSAASRRAGSSSGSGTTYGIPRGGDLLLGAGDPGRHRGLADQERVRDVGGRDAAHEPERQRQLRLPRERRMAADEHEPEAVVADHVLLGRDGSRTPAGAGAWRRASSRGAMTFSARRRATVVSQAPGLAGTPSRGQCFERLDVRVLHRLLRDVEIPRDAHRRGEHVGPLVTVRVFDGVQRTWRAKQRDHFHATVDDRRALGDRERGVEVARLDHEHAAEHLLRLQERAVGELALADRRGRLRGRLQRHPRPGSARRARPGAFRHVHVRLHDLRRQVLGGHALVEEHRVLGHHASCRVGNRWVVVPTG